MSNQKKDYDFYGFSTSNAFKVRIMFELLGIENYNYINVNIANNEQFSPSFLKLNPNNKIPVIVDNTVEPSLPIFESGAILIYLPDNKTHPRERTEVLQWLTWQVSTQGPAVGQFMHYIIHATEKIPYVIERTTNELDRVYKVLDGHLSTRKFVAGGQLSIADVAIYGWALYERFGLFPEFKIKYPHVFAWLDNLENSVPAFKNTLNYALDAAAKYNAAKQDAEKNQ